MSQFPKQSISHMQQHDSMTCNTKVFMSQWIQNLCCHWKLHMLCGFSLLEVGGGCKTFFCRRWEQKTSWSYAVLNTDLSGSCSHWGLGSGVPVVGLNVPFCTAVFWLQGLGLMLFVLQRVALAIQSCLSASQVAILLCMHSTSLWFLKLEPGFWCSLFQ